MNDLLTAIQNHFRADAVLAAAVPGGLFNVTAPPQMGSTKPISEPYAVAVPLGSSPNMTSGDPYVETYGIQFSIFGANPAQVETARTAFRQRFDKANCIMFGDDTYCLAVMPQSETLEREEDGTWHASIDYEFMVQRNVA